jgi:prephenate dehydrogenase
MGHWFVRYLSKTHNSLLVFDIRSNSAYDRSGVIVCKSLNECVAHADVVIICVPLSETSVMIRKCAAIMRIGASLIEISSIKYNTYRALKQIKRRINLLCIHPMFGPGSIKSNTRKILMIPVKNKKIELHILYCLFADIKISVIKDWKIHDEYMSVLLSLVYYINILFAGILAGQDISTLKALSGTTFAIQSLLSEGMLSDESSLITSLLVENPLAFDLVKRYNSQSAILAEYIFNRDKPKIKSLIEDTKAALARNIDLDLSYSKIYEVFGALPKERYRK